MESGNPLAKSKASPEGLKAGLAAFAVLVAAGALFDSLKYTRAAEIMIAAALLVLFRWARFEPADALNTAMWCVTWSFELKQDRYPRRLLGMFQAFAIFSFYAIVSGLLYWAAGERAAEFSIGRFAIRESLAIAISWFFLRRSAWPLLPLRWGIAGRRSE